MENVKKSGSTIPGIHTMKTIHDNMSEEMARFESLLSILSETDQHLYRNQESPEKEEIGGTIHDPSLIGLYSGLLHRFRESVSFFDRMVNSVNDKLGMHQ